MGGLSNLCIPIISLILIAKNIIKCFIITISPFINFKWVLYGDLRNITLWKMNLHLANIFSYKNLDWLWLKYSPRLVFCITNVSCQFFAKNFGEFSSNIGIHSHRNISAENLFSIQLLGAEEFWITKLLRSWIKQAIEMRGWKSSSQNFQ